MTTYVSDEMADEITAALQRVFAEADFEDGDGSPAEDLIMHGGIRRVETFEEAMLLTSDKGLVVKYQDGSEAQIVVRAATPSRDADL